MRRVMLLALLAVALPAAALLTSWQTMAALLTSEQTNGTG